MKRLLLVLLLALCAGLATAETREDLYWRLRDRLWQVFDSIEPADGYSWEKA